ncbi:aminotransferase class I/II-fold pyridoxal phosphate-dependent enzyme [bacterium]|nr:aminotransferase class I/II-fold pyridoxal phosphate-dependent enzyme [bacterium]
MQNSKNPKYMEAYFIHGRDTSPNWDYSHHLLPPITSTTTFRMETAERAAQAFAQYANTEELPKELSFIYERLGEPTGHMLEDRIASAHGGDAALVYASGMAAIHGATCGLAKNGDHILSHRSVYGCTYSLFTKWAPRMGISIDFIDFVHANIEEFIKPNTKLLYFETPINPTLELVDIERVKKAVDAINQNRNDENKILIVVDNTFASPVCQRPLSFGTDIVVESMTKHIGGFNANMGGVIVIPKRFYNHLLLHRKDTGGVLHGKTAWPILVYGLSTLPTRMRQEQETAIKVAKYLSQHPKIKEVHYPGLETFPQYALAKKQMVGYSGEFMPGTVFYAILKGDNLEKVKNDGAKVINWLAKNAFSYTMAVSLGCIKTLIEHPGSMTHAAIPVADQIKAGIHPGGLRVSCGLEEPEMLIEEMEEALKQI